MPAFLAHHLANEELELARQKAPIGRQLELRSPKSRFDDREQSREEDHRGEHGSRRRHADEPRQRGAEQ
jgi:hypothetical protein